MVSTLEAYKVKTWFQAFAFISNGSTCTAYYAGAGSGDELLQNLAGIVVIPVAEKTEENAASGGGVADPAAAAAAAAPISYRTVVGKYV